MIRTEISQITELIWLGILLLATLVPYPSLRKAPNDRPHRLRNAGGLALWQRARCPFYDNLPVTTSDQNLLSHRGLEDVRRRLLEEVVRLLV